MLYQSTDQGHTWKSKDITPRAGRYRYAWLALSPDGSKLGIGVCYTPDSSTFPWRVYGTILNPWQKPQLVSLDDNNPVAPAGSEPPGDYMGSYFMPSGSLGSSGHGVNSRLVSRWSAVSISHDRCRKGLVHTTIAERWRKTENGSAGATPHPQLPVSNRQRI
jgi:hypothetical protein